MHPSKNLIYLAAHFMKMNGLQDRIHGCISLKGKTSMFCEMCGTHLIWEPAWSWKQPKQLLEMALFWGWPWSFACPQRFQDKTFEWHVMLSSMALDPGTHLSDCMVKPLVGMSGIAPTECHLAFFVHSNLFSYLLVVLVLILLVICCYQCNWVYVLKVSTLVP